MNTSLNNRKIKSVPNSDDAVDEMARITDQLESGNEVTGAQQRGRKSRSQSYLSVCHMTSRHGATFISKQIPNIYS